MTGWGCRALPTSTLHPAVASAAFTRFLTRATHALGPTRFASRPQRSRRSHAWPASTYDHLSGKRALEGPSRGATPTVLDRYHGGVVLLDGYQQPLAVVPVTVKVVFAPFIRPRTWMDPIDDEVLIVACWPVFAMASNVVQGEMYVGAVKITVRVTPRAAAVTIHESLAGSQKASPRITGAPASAALPPEPPHPARSITAHAMTAPAAFPLAEREPNAPK